MEATPTAITTVSFFRYRGWADRWWGFKQMGLAGKGLEQVEGLRFAKMLGSGGGNGFSIWPNLGTYGLLGVWESEAAAEQFFQQHPLYQSFRERCTSWWNLYMHAAKAHGEWEGEQPFPISAPYDPQRLVGVLTRATIYTKHLWRFWRFVPPVSRSIEDKPGLLFSVGIGELPLIQQATFSLWENSEKMMDYAYRSRYHKEVVRRTRELGWYEEELFARFHPYRSEGDWENGQTPIDHVALKPTANR
jgi:hypothetical protein